MTTSSTKSLAAAVVAAAGAAPAMRATVMSKPLKSIPGGRIGNFLAGAAVAAVLGGTAVAVTSADFTYSAVQRGYYTINAMAMAPQSDESAEDYLISYPMGALTSFAGNACYQTGINLPQGATVVSVTTWYQSDLTSDASVSLYRQNLLNNTKRKLISEDIIDDNNTREFITHTVPTTLRTVNNLYFSYGYAFCLGDGTHFSGARINYLFKTAGD
jgi:hypothetical protein